MTSIPECSSFDSDTCPNPLYNQVKACPMKMFTRGPVPITCNFPEVTPEQRKAEKTKGTLRMLSVIKQITESADAYLADKETVPDAFFLYGVADAINTAMTLAEAAIMMFLTLEIKDSDLDKNVDTVNTINELKAALARLQKYAKRLRSIAIAIPSVQITRVD